MLFLRLCLPSGYLGLLWPHGTLFVLLYTGQGLNMISLFAFLLTLGIVVDDAIIVGGPFTRHRAGASVESTHLVGARQVLPVIFA